MTTPYETMLGSPFEADHPEPVGPSPEYQRQVAQAEAYVRTRFYPPLPVEYGALAVQAVEAYNDEGGLATIALPADLPILPRGAYEEDGEILVTAAHLVEVLRLEHLIEDEADFDVE